MIEDTDRTELSALGRASEHGSSDGAVVQERRVVVYVSHDQEHSQAILEKFQAKTGIKVVADYDTEDTKTVGLVSQLFSEREKPVADVFWNNECGQTERLKAEGLLKAYDSPSAKGIAKSFVDPDQMWTGFAARARVLMWNTDLVKDESLLPSRIEDLTDPKYKSQLAMARPRTGTTLTHLGALYSIWGQAKASAWMYALLENDVRWESGNGQVSRSVADGAIAFGLTDTDDFNGRLLEGSPVKYKFLDQGDSELGTLVIPNSVMILRNSPNPKEAELLVDYLLSLEVEEELARGRAAQMPLHAGAKVPPNVIPVDKIHAMPVDFASVGKMIERHQGEFEQMFSNVQGGKLVKGSGGSASLLIALGILIGFGILLFVMTGPRSKRSPS
jgi:iron(III) transport system substrate-binding protein